MKLNLLGLIGTTILIKEKEHDGPEWDEYFVECHSPNRKVVKLKHIGNSTISQRWVDVEWDIIDWTVLHKGNSDY